MATKVHTVDRDARITNSPNPANYGAGACDHLPVGVYCDPTCYEYQSWLAFIGESWSGIPSSASITSAVLSIYQGSGYHVYKESGNLRIRRTSSLGTVFTEGTASHPMTSTNGGGITGANDPATTATNEVTAAVTTASGWKSFTITNIVKDYYGQSNYALQLHAAVSDGIFEFSSRESGSAAYITITYNANSAPTAPTALTAAGAASGSIITDTTPTLVFTHNDPDSDACASYDIQVDTTTGDAVEPDWASLAWSTTDDVTGISGTTITKTTGTLSTGQWYAWRARTADATNGDGAWSATQYFKEHGTNTLSFTFPSASTQVGRMYKNAGSGASPRFYPAWSFSCAESGTQASGTYYIKDNGTSAILNGGGAGESIGTASSLQSAYDPSRSTSYKMDVTAVCTHGVSVSATQRSSVKAQWAVSAYKKDVTGATAFAAASPVSTTGSTSSVTVEYGSSSGGAEPGTWYASMQAAPLNNWQHYRVWLLAWNSASPTSPSLDSITLNWNSLSGTLDNWTLGTNTAVDLGQFIFGTQCLKITTTSGTQRDAYQELTGLQPNTTYTLSGYIKSSGNSRVALRITAAGTSTPSLAESDTAFPITATSPGDTWQRISCSYTTASETSLRVYATTLSTGSNGAYAWIDAMKLEASSVVTPWTPGFVGQAVTLDAGGIQINGTAAPGPAGRFRLTGTAGGTRDKVDLGANGLNFGSDVQISSPAAGQIKIDNVTGSADQQLLIGDDAILFDGDVADFMGVKGQGTAANGGIVFGSAKDTNIYRSAADTLKTDDSLVVAGSNGVTIGADTKLSRSAANELTLAAGDLLRYDPPSVSVERTATQSITASSAWNEIDFTATDLWDPWAVHDPSTNPSRITCKWTGKYRLDAWGSMTSDAGIGRIILGYALNGAGAGTPATKDERTTATGAAAFAFHVDGTWWFTATAGDYVEVYISQNKASAVNLTDGGALLEYIGD